MALGAYEELSKGTISGEVSRDKAFGISSHLWLISKWTCFYNSHIFDNHPSGKNASDALSNLITIQRSKECSFFMDSI